MSGDLGPSPTQISRMRGNIAQLVLGVERRRRRRTRILIAGATGAVAATLTAGVVVATWPDDIVAGAYLCFEADDPRSTSHGITYPIDLEPPATTSEQVDAALLLCASNFERAGLEAPAPTVCRLVDGRLGVFPNRERREPDELCTSLGLSAPDD